MPTTTKKPVAERRTNHKKRKHRTWIWWILVISPILVSMWLFILPQLGVDAVSLKTVSVEEAIKVPSSKKKAIRRPPAAGADREAYARPNTTQPPAAAGEEDSDEEGGIVSETVKDDVDWALGHLYKLMPLVISLLAILKKGAIMGRAS